MWFTPSWVACLSWHIKLTFEISATVFRVSPLTLQLFWSKQVSIHKEAKKTIHLVRKATNGNASTGKPLHPNHFTPSWAARWRTTVKNIIILHFSQLGISYTTDSLLEREHITILEAPTAFWKKKKKLCLKLKLIYKLPNFVQGQLHKIWRIMSKTLWNLKSNIFLTLWNFPILYRGSCTC